MTKIAIGISRFVTVARAGGLSSRLRASSELEQLKQPLLGTLRVPRAAQSSKVSALVGTLSTPNSTEPWSRRRLLRLLAT